MATIESYETKAGLRYMVRYRGLDRKQTKERGIKTKREALARKAAIEFELSRGEFIKPSMGQVTISELSEPWLDRKRGHLKPSSLRPLEISLRRQVLPRWENWRISEIRHTGVQQWITDMRRGDPDRGVKPLSATVVIRAYGILAGILDDAVKDQLLQKNPARGVTLPKKGKKAHVYLSHEDVHRLAEESEHPTVVFVLAYCGLRWGEMAALRVKDVNHFKRRLHVEQNAVYVGGDLHIGSPKTHEVRSVPFPKFLADPLRESCAGRHPDDLVFPGPDLRPMRTPRVSAESRSWLAGALRRAELPLITPHDLRHTAASLAVSARANVKAVQRMLGHASAAMTLDVYADLFDDDLDAVADRMNEAVSALSVPKLCPNQETGDMLKASTSA
ncbi:tyrosine-type recombinase/integrase [Citricoccus sp. NR2]|uniref:tyrosine-type recombinase/integrase n=1 Tax=Citricoccus sp. NR2 TaxID=3004095 RepID=UPI0022DD2FFA|nr:tyrosine-type recombinase/integrase [Citricoccus sp. NR2]WBL19197.1 tyrosine-type recombinase/integrase [Citricoccus sp. NR2]